MRYRDRLRAHAMLCTALAMIACGDDDSGGSATVDPEQVVRACAILNTCGTEVDAHNCLYKFDVLSAQPQLECVLAATASDCTAVEACVGLKRTPDSNCIRVCVDADTAVYCSEPGIRREIECPLYIDSGGASCVTTASASGCGTGTCSTEGEYSCNGTVSSACGSGIMLSVDCGRLGLECVPNSQRCLPPAVGPCTSGPSCDGDGLVACDFESSTSRRFDCSSLVGMTCQLYESTTSLTATCGFDTTCQSGATECVGNTLRACLGGTTWDIDCTSIGATTCRVLPNGVARCEL